jgi:hypothetical protein
MPIELSMLPVSEDVEVSTAEEVSVMDASVIAASLTQPIVPAQTKMRRDRPILFFYQRVYQPYTAMLFSWIERLSSSESLASFWGGARPTPHKLS